MGNLDRFKTYLLENQFKIIIFEDKIDISNYQSIEHFDTNKIIVKKEDKLVVIEGNNLLLTRLLTDEVLISGIIKKIELR